MCISACLDGIDGMIARKMGQCSHLGEVLDVLCDNIWRGSTWTVAAASAPPTHQVVIVPVAVLVVAVEWATLLASQVLAKAEGKGHWKKRGHSEPFLVREIFTNGLRNPLGVLVVAGLYGLPAMLAVAGILPGGNFSLSPNSPLWHLAMFAVAVVGRSLGLVVEGYFICQYLKYLAEEEQEAHGKYSGRFCIDQTDATRSNYQKMATTTTGGGHHDQRNNNMGGNNKLEEEGKKGKKTL